MGPIARAVTTATNAPTTAMQQFWHWHLPPEMQYAMRPETRQETREALRMQLAENYGRRWQEGID